MAEGLQIIWTPWRNRTELLCVRDWFFPPEPRYEEVKHSELQRRACDQTSAWKVRGNLPHAVESTWLLTEAVLIDDMPVDQIPVFAVKAAYITALSRFVTGLLDSQQESKYKVSMYTMAQQVGLPAVFVDIRHEAAHGDMPSLDNLRGAARRALRWLWDDYWKGLGEREAVAAVSGDVILQVSEDVEQGDGNRVDDAEEQLGSWERWQGRWKARPIGTIST